LNQTVVDVAPNSPYIKQYFSGNIPTLKLIYSSNNKRKIYPINEP